MFLSIQQVMEAEHEMELKDLRHQLKRVHSKDTKQEDYVSNPSVVDLLLFDNKRFFSKFLSFLSFIFLSFLQIY